MGTQINSTDVAVIFNSNRSTVRTSGGTIYQILNVVVSATTSFIEVWKSTNGSTWAEQDHAHSPNSGGVYSGCTGAIDSAGVIHIVYRNEASMTPTMRYVQFNTATDLFQNDAQITTLSASEHGACGVAVDSNDKPHAFWAESITNMGSSFLTLQYSNRISGAWATKVEVYGQASSKTVAIGPSMLIDNNNKPQLAFVVATDSKIRAAIGNANNATSFTLSDCEASTDVLQVPVSIALDSSNNTWVSYCRNTTNDQLYLVKHNAADAWTTWQTPVTDSKAVETGPSHGGEGHVQSIAINGTTIYAIYQRRSDGNIVYQTYTGTWSAVTVLEATDVDHVNSKWAQYDNNGGATQIDYCYTVPGSGVTNAFWNKIDLVTATPLTQTAADDANNLADALTKQLNVVLTVTLSDSANNLSDALTGMGYGLLVTENANNLSDSLALGHGLVFSDATTTLTDALTKTESYELSFSDSVHNLSDAQSQQLGVIESLADTLATLADAQAQLLVYLLALTDSQAANWADAHQLLLAQQLALADNSFNAADAATVQLGQLLPFSDSLSLTDTEAHTLATLLTLSDSINNLADPIQLQLGYSLALSDINLDFPATTTLDDFNRPDEGPPPSTNWSVGFAASLEGTDEPGHKVTSNQLSNVGNDINQNWWNVSQFGPDCEAWITITDSTGLVAVGLAARLTNIVGFSSDGYYVQVNSSGGGDSRTYQLARIDAGTATFLVTTSETGVGPMTGDRYGIRVIGNAIQLWGDTGSGWDVKLSTTDSTYSTQGYLGILTEATTSTRLDDFSGGTVAGGLLDSLQFGYGLLLTDAAFNLTDAYAQQKHDVTNALELELDDALVLSDSLALGHGLLASDSFSLTDSVEEVLGELIELADTTTPLTDSASLQLGQLISFSDSFILVDSESSILGYNELLSDSIDNLDDSSALELGELLTFADTLSLTDALTLGVGLALIDTTATLDDSAQLELQQLLDFTDALILTDSQSSILGYGKLLADSTDNLSDAETHQLAHLLSFDDSINNLADAYLQTLGDSLSFSDSLTLLDTLILGYGLLIAEDLNLFMDDIVTSAPQGPLRQVGMTDALATLTDELALRLDYLLAVSDDAATLDDSISLLEGLRTTFSDSFSFTDSLAATLGYLQPLADSFSLSDTVQLRVGYEITVSDTISLSDSITLQLGYGVSTDDAITLTDSTSLAEAYLLALSDLVTLTDSESATLSYQRSLSDSFALSDSVQLQLRYSPTATDSLSLSDSISLRLGYQLATSDSLVLTDALQAALGFRAALSDSFTLTDSESATLGHLIQLVDAFVLTDSIQLRLGYELAVIDTITLTDATTRVLGYFIALTDNAALLADSTLISPGLTAIISDNLEPLTDATSLSSAGFLRLSDTIILSDSFATFGEYFAAFSDSFLLTDDVAIELRGPDLDESLSDSLQLDDAIAITLANELRYELAFTDALTLSDHYFDLRFPYTPSAKRHIVVPSRARVTRPTARAKVVVPSSDRTTKIQ